MPTSDEAVAAAIFTIDEFVKGVDDSIVDEVVEYYWFKDRAKKFRFNAGGTGVSWNVRLDRGTVEGFNRAKRLSVVRKNRVQQARLTNRGYGIGELIHTTDLWENRSPEKITDFLDELLTGMTSDMIDALGTGIYDDGASGNHDNLGFQGADAALISSGSYAGLSTTTFAGWSSNVATGDPYDAFSDDPLPALDKAIADCRAGLKGGRSRTSPDVGFMTHDNWNVCLQTFMRRQRLAQDAKAVNAGWNDNFVYRGVTFFPSDYVSNGSLGNDGLYLFNSKWVDFRFPSPKLINQFRYDEGVPKALYIIMIVYGLMRFRQPRTCGKFTIT